MAAAVTCSARASSFAGVRGGGSLDEPAEGVDLCIRSAPGPSLLPCWESSVAGVRSWTGPSSCMGVAAAEAEAALGSFLTLDCISSIASRLRLFSLCTWGVTRGGSEAPTALPRQIGGRILWRHTTIAYSLSLSRSTHEPSLQSTKRPALSLSMAYTLASESARAMSTLDPRRPSNSMIRMRDSKQRPAAKSPYGEDKSRLDSGRCSRGSSMRGSRAWAFTSTLGG